MTVRRLSGWQTVVEREREAIKAGRYLEFEDWIRTHAGEVSACDKCCQRIDSAGWPTRDAAE